MTTDYDRLSATYHQRYQVNALPGVAAHLAQAAAPHAGTPMLEAGCGSGHWLNQLADAGAPVCGLDFSAGMLAQARQRPQAGRFALIHGHAVMLPCADGRFGLVAVVNALHHFGDAPAFIREAWRVLRPGGTLFIASMDPHHPHTRWSLYDYFPTTRPRDLARFISAGALVDRCIAAGFTAITWRVAEVIERVARGPAILADHFLERHSTSQLADLPLAEYEAGLARLRADVTASGPACTFTTHIPMYALTARKAL